MIELALSIEGVRTLLPVEQNRKDRRNPSADDKAERRRELVVYTCKPTVHA